MNEPASRAFTSSLLLAVSLLAAALGWLAFNDIGAATVLLGRDGHVDGRAHSAVLGPGIECGCGPRRRALAGDPCSPRTLARVNPRLEEGSSYLIGVSSLYKRAPTRNAADMAATTDGHETARHIEDYEPMPPWEIHLYLGSSISKVVGFAAAGLVTIVVIQVVLAILTASGVIG